MHISMKYIPLFKYLMFGGYIKYILKAFNDFKNKQQKCMK